MHFDLNQISLKRLKLKNRDVQFEILRELENENLAFIAKIPIENKFLFDMIFLDKNITAQNEEFNRFAIIHKTFQMVKK